MAKITSRWPFGPSKVVTGWGVFFLRERVPRKSIKLSMWHVFLVMLEIYFPKRSKSIRVKWERSRSCSQIALMNATPGSSKSCLILCQLPPITSVFSPTTKAVSIPKIGSNWYIPKHQFWGTQKKLGSPLQQQLATGGVLFATPRDVCGTLHLAFLRHRV